MIELIKAHPQIDLIACYWIFSAAVGAMPIPNGKSQGYEFLYKFMHTIAGNITTAFGNRVPGASPNNNPGGKP